MTKKTYFLTAILGLLITTALVSITSFAAQGNGVGPGPFGDPQHHDQMAQIIADSDYDAWAALMQERVDDMRQRADELETQITLDNFNKLQEAHQLIEDGNIQEAKALLEELGLKGPHPGFRGMHKGFGMAPATQN